MQQIDERMSLESPKAGPRCCVLASLRGVGLSRHEERHPRHSVASALCKTSAINVCLVKVVTAPRTRLQDLARATLRTRPRATPVFSFLS